MILIVLILVLLLASLWDFKKGKIPNLLIAAGCGYGILRSLYYQNFLTQIPGIIFPILILYPFFKIGTIGAGDIKLFSVIGFYFSFMECIVCMLTAFVIAAIVSILSFDSFSDIKERLMYLVSYLKDYFQQGHFHYYYMDSSGSRLSLEKEKESKIHMAFPIFLSVIIQAGGGFL